MNNYCPGCGAECRPNLCPRCNRWGHNPYHGPTEVANLRLPRTPHLEVYLPALQAANGGKSRPETIRKAIEAAYRALKGLGEPWSDEEALADSLGGRRAEARESLTGGQDA